MALIEKYGQKWQEETSDLEIEMACIRAGGYQEGLPFHYEQMRHILWPHLDNHRWEIQCRDAVLLNRITVLMGCASSGKTHTPSWVYLCEYLCWPEETAVLVSSTDIRGLRLRAWGEITLLHTQAKLAFQERGLTIPGKLLDSRLLIATDDIEEDETRDMRKGIIGIPCVQNGKFVGLGKYCGIKQKRVRLIADEAQFMGASFLSAFSNLGMNVDFRAVILGNPNDIMDPLGRAAEPLDGWTSHMEPSKTTSWRTRFMDGICVNLVGTDSPNFDHPEDEKPRYPYLISAQKIKDVLSFFAKDSIEYYSQCVGVMKIGLLARRVLTPDLCRKFNAFGTVIWKSETRKRIAALDAAYGGDRCIIGRAEFGEDIDGRTLILLHPPVIVPILANVDVVPEDQISAFVKQYCETHGIAPEDFFHDSTGRGTLGTSLARIWSPLCNPVEFGGVPTERPVTNDFYIVELKGNQEVKRLKTCREHYVKFVTELWFSFRYTVEANQLRGLPEDVMDEFCLRQWDRVKDDKIELESKEEMKLRVGRSPDLADWGAIIIEGARRRGFKIARLLPPEPPKSNKPDWLSRHTNDFEQMVSKRALSNN